MIWEIAKTKSQIKRKIKRIFHSKRKNKTPMVVATPFPPLNLSQTGKMWPKIGEMATKTIFQSRLKKLMAK